MKKILSLLLAAVFTLSLCACGGNAGEAPAQNPEPEETVSASPFDFGDIHYSLWLPVYEIVSADGIWGPTEYSNFTYNSKGQLIEKTDSYSTYTFEYDDLGRLVKETQTTNYGFDSYVYTYADEQMSDFYKISPYQNRTGMILIEKMESSDSNFDGNTLHHEYQFDTHNRVIQNAWSNYGIGSRIVEDYEYDAFGRIAVIIQSNYTNGILDGGYDSQYFYDGLGRLVRETFSDRYSDYSSSFDYTYDVTRREEISTAADDTLLTTDRWTAFPEADRIPMPHSCLQGISQPEQSQEAAETVYTFFLTDNRKEADQMIQKYLAILKDVCGFSWEVGSNAVSIWEGAAPTATLTTGTDPVQGCYLQIHFQNK